MYIHGIHIEKNIQAYENVVNSAESFYKKIEDVELHGKHHRFQIYLYRLAEADEFIKFAPVSFEMRGITFDDSGNVFPSIHKFFNHRENQLVSDNITGTFEIREKIDGSLVQPVVIGDDIICKTKSTFDSWQAKKVTELVNNNKNLKTFILDAFYEHGLQPLFEYISPDNQVVVKYSVDELVLTQLRDRNTGKYISYMPLVKLANRYNISVVPAIQDDIDKLLKKKETMENIEGWVVQKMDDQNYTGFRKIKTIWYLNLHRLLAYEKLSEDVIIQLILDERIDDVLSNLNDNDKKAYIENIIHALNHYMKTKSKEIYKIFSQERELFCENPKAFVEKHKNSDVFPVIMKVVRNGYDENTVLNNLKELIKKRTNKLSTAREFLQSLESNSQSRKYSSFGIRSL